MSHIVIAEALVVVATITVASVLASAMTMKANDISHMFRLYEVNAKDKVYSHITIIFATNVTDTSVKIWIKNTGLKEIHGDLIAKSDVFFGPKGNFTRVPHESTTTLPPLWNYTIVNDDGDGRWDPCETLEVTITWDTILNPGEYYVKFVLYNGVSDEYVFSI